MLRIVIALLLLCAPASAQDGRRHAEAAAQAAMLLGTQLTDIAASRNSLKLGEPPVAATFATIFNIKALREQPPPVSQDMLWLLQWHLAASTSYQQIVDFGSGPSGVNQQAAVMDILRHNQTEMVSALEFMLLLTPMMTSTAIALFEAFPVEERNSPRRQAGYARMRNGYIGTINATLTFIMCKPEPANAQRITSSLRATMADWLKLTDAESRAMLLRSLALAGQQNDNASVRDDLIAIEQAVATAK